MKTKKSNDSLKGWYSENFRNIFSNNRHRIIVSLVLIVVAIIWLFYSAPLVNNISWIVNQILALMLLFVPFLYCSFYVFRSLGQVGSELALNLSIYWIRKDIKKSWKKKNLRSLQIKMNRVWRDLKDFVESSSVLGPPVHRYELDRLHKSIDIFFNTASEVLFPNPFLFSRRQEIDKQLSKDYYDNEEHPTEEELGEMFEEAQKRDMGVIDWFDFPALDEFIIYLGKILFSPTTPYSPLSPRHPINLIILNNFFDTWNSIIASCGNSKSVYEKVKGDIEKYYEEVEKREAERRQRIRGLTDNVLIIIISSMISIIVTYLTRI